MVALSDNGSRSHLLLLKSGELSTIFQKIRNLNQNCLMRSRLKTRCANLNESIETFSELYTIQYFNTIHTFASAAFKVNKRRYPKTLCGRRDWRITFLRACIGNPPESLWASVHCADAKLFWNSLPWLRHLFGTSFLSDSSTHYTCPHYFARLISNFYQTQYLHPMPSKAPSQKREIADLACGISGDRLKWCKALL